MNFKEYKEYTKDNPKGLWFKECWYGWGWVPVRWQGWVVVASFIGVVILDGVYLAAKSSSNDPSLTDLVFFFVILAIAAFVLFLICFKKGERPHWNWGDPRKNNKTRS